MNAIVLALIVLLSQSAEERMRAGEFVEAAATLEEQLRQPGQIGRASCRERV